MPNTEKERRMKQLLTLQETMDYLNVSKPTLHRWDKSSKLKAVRTAGGHRRYRIEDVEKLAGEQSEMITPSNEIIVATYARCSTSDQKQHGDIDRQSQRLSEYCAKKKYKVGYIIKDMGSGINDKRKGFMKLCNLVVEQKINKVVIEHKDRLTRFQYNLIEFFFKSYGVDIELTDKKEYTEQEELVNDMMMLIASFSGRLYSSRAKENSKKRKEEKEKHSQDVMSYESQRCDDCEFFDGHDMCLRKENFGSITNETIDKCDKDKLFRDNVNKPHNE